MVSAFSHMDLNYDYLQDIVISLSCYHDNVIILSCQLIMLS
jgi:hypothetical protein